MPQAASTAFYKMLTDDEEKILAEWMAKVVTVSGAAAGDARAREIATRLLHSFQAAARDGHLDSIHGSQWEEARQVLTELSGARAKQGATPRETAMFVFALKETLFTRLRAVFAKDPEALAEQTWQVSNVLDELGVFTMEVFQKTREAVISRQQQDMMELSTPVVQLWDDVLGLPLIGTLDSERTQVVMENLLQKIVETGASIAIIDITGVPTVDTLVAQHLLKTIAAARLMGADCIISGIRPQIAQTIVHLGVDLEDVVTKATLADAFVVALARTGATIVKASDRR